jgi:hypothetical protein
MEPTKIVIEVSGGVVCNVYGSNVEFVVVDWDNVDSGEPLPTPDQFWPAQPHDELDAEAFKSVFGEGR